MVYALWVDVSNIADRYNKLINIHKEVNNSFTYLILVK